MDLMLGGRNGVARSDCCLQSLAASCAPKSCQFEGNNSRLDKQPQRRRWQPRMEKAQRIRNAAVGRARPAGRSSVSPARAPTCSTALSSSLSDRMASCARAP